MIGPCERCDEEHMGTCRRSEGKVLEADTYVPANRTTGERARIVATLPKAETGDSLKKDFGKDPWHLAPWDAFLCIVKVLAFGAKKYAPNGWRVGMSYSRLYSALQRHLVGWWTRSGVDPDTGYSHLWHAGACVCFLIAYELDGTLREHDDRPILNCILNAKD